MNSAALSSLCAALTSCILVSASFAATDGILCPSDAAPNIKLAAREVRRYVYLRTGKLLPLLADSGRGARIILKTDASLDPQQYRLKSDGRQLVISGGSDLGVLYGAYAYAEKLGVRFYLHGDVIPDERLAALPEVNEKGRPLFATRGIQPFHDFAEGPDWWNQDDYLACVDQLARMKMNFLGLHTYPQSSVGPEPLVWIGLPDDVNKDGTVKFSYPSCWHSTARDGMWAYAAMKTSEFASGAAQLFPADDYGPDVMAGMMPGPASPEACNELFNRVGRQMGVVFAQARKRGVKTCIGTETPLTVPDALREHLTQLGKDSRNPKVVRELYEGMFKRIMLTMPADYYWLWTPERWTWGGNKPAQFEATVRDIQTAYDALKGQGKPMQLATCGWVLGPQHDRAALDAVLPKDCPMSCINRKTGDESVEYAFANIQNRPKWAIPWMENDPGLTSYQPWAARMRYDAVDARRLGCDGLIGIHWRTKIMAMNVAALAGAAWDQSWVPAGHDISPIQPFKPGSESNAAPGSVTANPADNRRAMPVRDFYADFARAHFGDNVAVAAGELLAAYDGQSRYPTVSDWKDGPGGLLDNADLGGQTLALCACASGLSELRPHVTGKGNLERFDYWLNTIRVSNTQRTLSTLRGKLNGLMGQIAKEQDAARRATLVQDALTVRIALARKWEEMLTFQIAAADTPGELGTIANLETHTRKRMNFVTGQDDALEKALGHALPAACALSMAYAGPERIIVPTVRSSVNKGEALTLKIIALLKQPAKSITVRIRPLGARAWQTVDAAHVSRAVYSATLPAATGDFEYCVFAEPVRGTTLTWPATAPKLNRTVVVTDE